MSHLHLYDCFLNICLAGTIEEFEQSLFQLDLLGVETIFCISVIRRRYHAREPWISEKLSLAQRRLIDLVNIGIRQNYRRILP